MELDAQHAKEAPVILNGAEDDRGLSMSVLAWCFYLPVVTRISST